MTAEVTLLLDNFAAKTEEQHDEELKSRSLHLVKTRRQTKTIAPFKIVMITIAIVVISSVMILSRVMLTELTEDANSYEKKITKLNTEYTRLEAELEAKTSIKTIAEAAESSLGLSKIDSSQIEYVNLTNNDEVKVAKSTGEKIKEEAANYWEKFVSLFD